MRIYYDQKNQKICINETYETLCHVDDNINNFFNDVRTFFRKLIGFNDTNSEHTKQETVIIEYFCQQNLFFPHNFAVQTSQKLQTYQSELVQQGFNNQLIIKLFEHSKSAVTKYLKFDEIVDSDPRTNGTIKQR